MPFKVILVDRASHEEDVLPGECIFGQAVVTVGRNEGNLITLPDSKRIVSSKHAEIRQQDNHYVLVDVGSKNGTTVNDHRIPVGQDHLLQDQDVIGIGKYKMIFQSMPEPTTTVLEDFDPDATVCFSSSVSPYQATVQHVKKASRQLIGRDSQEREAMLLEVLRESVQGLSQEEAWRLVEYVEAAFPDPDYQQEMVVSHAIVSLSKPSPPFAQSFSEHSPSMGKDNRSGRFSSLSMDENSDQLSRQKDAVIALFLEYVADVVRSRREFEQELEVEVTKIFSRERNPIKWAESSKEIADYLFDMSRPSPTLDQALKDLKQTLSDLARHPFGMMAGFRECIRGLLKQLNPSVIAREAKSGSLSFPIQAWPSLTKTAAWNQFVQMHQTLTEEETKTIQTLLRNEFGKGYLRAYHESSKS